MNVNNNNYNKYRIVCSLFYSVVKERSVHLTGVFGRRFVRHVYLLKYLPPFLLSYLLTYLILPSLFTYLHTYLLTYLLTSFLITYILNNVLNFIHNYLLTDLLTYIHTNLLLLPYILTYILTCVLTYLLTPRSRFLLEKLTGYQLVKKFPAFYGTRKFITAFTNVHHVFLS
jgi:hypothetical protein